MCLIKWTSVRKSSPPQHYQKRTQYQIKKYVRRQYDRITFNIGKFLVFLIYPISLQFMVRGYLSHLLKLNEKTSKSQIFYKNAQPIDSLLCLLEMLLRNPESRGGKYSKIILFSRTIINKIGKKKMQLNLQKQSSYEPPLQNSGLINYNSNRIREYYHKNPNVHNKYQQSICSSIIKTDKIYSVNKIHNLGSKNANQKIEMIKMRCFDVGRNKKAITTQKNSNKNYNSNNAININGNFSIFNKNINNKQLLQTNTHSKINTNKQIVDNDQNTSYDDMQQQTDDCILQKNQNLRMYIQQSIFPNRPSTLYFQYPSVCSIDNHTLISSNSNLCPLSKIPQLHYKINGWQYKCIINTLEFNGWKEAENGNVANWNIYFDIRGNKTKKIQDMAKGQKISHFPGCWYIGRKDFLWRGINKIRRSFPKEYDFVPMTYLLPGDFQRFQYARQNADKGQLWIMKPAASACGRGIHLLSKTSHPKNRPNHLISTYISNPHLINNLKYDLRVYILVTSYDPLRIYFFQNGLVRFATSQYNVKSKDIKKRYVHLTNFSVNKHSKNFIKKQNDGDDDLLEGSKWSFVALRKYYTERGIDADKVFRDIQDVVIKTCISAEPNMLDIHSKSQERRNCCFQLYGFDILIDANLKPWLMQVNVCPSLSSSSPMDRKIKHTLITDILNLIGIEHKSQKSSKPMKDNFTASGSLLTQQISVPSYKKIYSKNINNLENLCYQNCLDVLSPEDWLILLESEQELHRCGNNFKKIFPLKENIQKYSHLFEFKRYYNLVLWKSLLSRNSFLGLVLGQ